jgi:glutamyl-tRNA synthetase
MDALRWIGAEWDEGPYFQSERAGLHRQAAERIYADGLAYYCDCTREQIEARTKGNATPGYDGFCRDRGLGPGPGGRCGSERRGRAPPPSSISSEARRRSRTG